MQSGKQWSHKSRNNLIFLTSQQATVGCGLDASRVLRNPIDLWEGSSRASVPLWSLRLRSTGPATPQRLRPCVSFAWSSGFSAGPVADASFFLLFPSLVSPSYIADPRRLTNPPLLLTVRESPKASSPRLVLAALRSRCPALCSTPWFVDKAQHRLPPPKSPWAPCLRSCRSA